MKVIYSLPFSFECGQRSVAVLNGRIWCAVLKQDAGKAVGSQRDYCVVLKVSWTWGFRCTPSRLPMSQKLRVGGLKGAMAGVETRWWTNQHELVGIKTAKWEEGDIKHLKHCLQKTWIFLFGPKMEWRGLNNKLHYQTVFLEGAMKSELFCIKKTKK